MVEGRNTAEGDEPKVEAPTEAAGSDRTTESTESPTQTPSKLYELASEGMEDRAVSGVFRRERDKAAEGQGFLDFNKGSADDLLKENPQGRRHSGEQPKPSAPGEESTVPVRPVRTETVQGKPDANPYSSFTQDGPAPFSGFKPAESTAQPTDGQLPQSEPRPESQTKTADTSPEPTNELPQAKSVKTVNISGPAPGYNGFSTFQPSSNFQGGDKTPHIVDVKTRTVDPEVAMSTPAVSKDDKPYKPSSDSDSKQTEAPQLKSWTVADIQSAVKENPSYKTEAGKEPNLFNPTPIAYQNTPMSGGTFPNKETSGSPKYEAMFSPSAMEKMPMGDTGKSVDFGGKSGGGFEQIKPNAFEGGGKTAMEHMFNPAPIANNAELAKFSQQGASHHMETGPNLINSIKDFDKTQSLGHNFNGDSAIKGDFAKGDFTKTNADVFRNNGDISNKLGGDFSKGDFKSTDFINKAGGDFLKGTGDKADLSPFKGDSSSLSRPGESNSGQTGRGGGDTGTAGGGKSNTNNAASDFSAGPNSNSRPLDSRPLDSGTGISKPSSGEALPNIHSSGGKAEQSFEPPRSEKTLLAPEHHNNQHLEKPVTETTKPVPSEQLSQSKATEQQQLAVRQVAAAGASNTADAAVQVSAKQFSDFSSTLARATMQGGGAASLENIAAASIKSGSSAVELAVSDKSATGKVTSAGSQLEITGPVSLASLNSKAGLFIGETNAVTLTGRALANAEAAAGNAALTAAKQQAADSSAVSALTAGKGIFDPQAINKGAQFDVITGKLVQTSSLNPNIAAAIAAAASAGNRIGAVNPVGTQSQTEGLNPATPGIRTGRIDPSIGRLEPLNTGSRLDPVTGRIIAVPGESKGEFDLTELSRIRKSLNGNDKRYLTGVEIALAVAIASAAVAKTRPEGEEDQVSDETTNDDDKNNAQQASHFKRPVHLVAENDSLVEIAERIFHNSDVAWLIADINAGRITEHMEDGKRIIELRSRQEIELPLLSEVNEFLLDKKADIKAENMVTIVGVSEIDRELLNSFLSTVVGGEVIESVPAPSTVLVPAAAPAQQPLMALVNFGVAMSKSLMPSMNSLVQQGLNLRTYISKIDFIHVRQNLKPEIQI